MKQTPELDRVQERMQPGELTLHGFLGSDDRKLADILAEDAATVRRLRLTHARIADRLADLGRKGVDIMEQELQVEDRYHVRGRDDRGVLPSPWGDGTFGKGDVHLRDERTGHELRWNGLTLHLIRAHGFYGGKGSDYRIDPAAAAAALELPPEEDAPDADGDSI